MTAKLVWFLLGALFASVFWIIAAIGLSERLMQIFYGRPLSAENCTSVACGATCSGYRSP